MSARPFNTFAKLIEYNGKCPICSKELTYQISTIIFDNTLIKNIKLTNLKVATALERGFDASLNSHLKSEEISVKFKPIETNSVNVEKLNTTIDIHNNKIIANYDGSLSFFNLKMFCFNEEIGSNEYEAKGEFEGSENSINQNAGINGKYTFEIENIKLYHEIYKLCNVDFYADTPNGSFVKIINDFNIDKTSFALSEANLDGTKAFHTEKRINLVDDDYFKFNNKEKVFAKINTIFLLSDK